MKNSSSKVFSNFLWRFMERCGAQGVGFVLSIILARLLDPSVYGVVALVTVFTSILNVFVDSGMGSALVQKKDADDLDFSSVFYFNVVICSVLYLIMFFAAPLIAAFYEKPELTPIVRVVSLVLLISGVKNTQIAYVSKHMIFKKFFFATLGGTLGAAVLGIVMAYYGFGVWALIVQSLFNNVVDTIILWITVKWRPKRMFSWTRLKGLISYGWKLMLSTLIDTVYQDIRQLIIGKQYSSADLAFYNKGKRLPNLAVQNINSSIDSVLLPAMSSEQDDRSRVRAMTRRAIRTSTYLLIPIMVGIAVCARPLIDLLLTAKWLPCVPYLQIFCLAYILLPVHTANLNAIKAMGRSDLFLKMEIIKKVIGMASVLATMFISVKAMAYSVLFTSLVSQVINSWPNKKLLGYSYFDQIKDMLPPILLSAFMGGTVFCITLFGLSDIATLAIQIPLGIAIYIVGSKLFRFEIFTYILNMLKSFFKKKKPAATNTDAQ